MCTQAGRRGGQGCLPAKAQAWYAVVILPTEAASAQANGAGERLPVYSMVYNTGCRPLSVCQPLSLPSTGPVRGRHAMRGEQDPRRVDRREREKKKENAIHCTHAA